MTTSPTNLPVMTPVAITTETVKVTISVTVKLERIEWSHLKTEDYYVHVNGRCLGGVGRDASDDTWHAFSGKKDLHQKLWKREYRSRKTAIAALIREASNLSILPPAYTPTAPTNA